MPNYVFDKAYKIETTGGVSANVIVVHGSNDAGCKIPTAANEGKVLGVTTQSAAQDHFVPVRKNGIASVIAASSINKGDAVSIADNQGRIKTAAKASGVSGVIGNNNAIRWTASLPGISANGIVVDIVIAGNNTALSVSVSGNTITINSATNGSGEATTTASQAIAAVANNANASKLISGANESTSSGTGVIADETVLLSGGELGTNIIGYAEESASAQGDIIDVFLTF